jgi:superfamily II DNA/RNA helicase
MITVSEKKIEQKLVRTVKSLGGLALKFISPGFVGVPDRIILFPSGRIVFAETKSSGGKLRPIQTRRKQQLENLGFKVFVINGELGIEMLLESLNKKRNNL